MNMYEYVKIEPTKGLDPKGLDYIEIIGTAVYWIVEEDGFWYNPDVVRHYIGEYVPPSPTYVGSRGEIILTERMGGGTIPVNAIYEEGNFWLNYPDISDMSTSEQQWYIQSYLNHAAGIEVVKPSFDIPFYILELEEIMRC